MKIHTIARDAKQMQMAELEAINRRAAEVQATPTDNDGTVEQPEQAAEEAKEEATDAKATRPKKKKAGVRPN